MKHWVLIYDISNSKRLQKIAKIMENYGVRVQYSVFEVIATSRTIQEIRQKVQRVIEPKEDSVIYFEICSEDWQKQRKYGLKKYEIYEDKDYNIL